MSFSQRRKLPRGDGPVEAPVDRLAAACVKVPPLGVPMCSGYHVEVTGDGGRVARTVVLGEDHGVRTEAGSGHPGGRRGAAVEGEGEPRVDTRERVAAREAHRPQTGGVEAAFFRAVTPSWGGVGSMLT